MSEILRHQSGKVMQPIGQVPKRLPQHGRIRTGEFAKGKKFPTSLKHFRFTSPDKGAIEHLAHTYGGTVQPWKNPKANPPEQWQVTTTSDVIAVSLVPASVKLNYELWGNGFLRRRCDGVDCFARKPGNPPTEVVMACICNTKGNVECSPVTRLNVVLPGLPFKGTWMLQSNGWNVFSEMPGVAALLENMASGQLIDAHLRLTSRQKDGGQRKFVVPVIELPESLQELADGKRDQMLEAGRVMDAPALEMADPLAAIDFDDQVTEAELVEDE